MYKQSRRVWTHAPELTAEDELHRSLRRSCAHARRDETKREQRSNIRSGKKNPFMSIGSMLGDWLFFFFFSVLHMHMCVMQGYSIQILFFNKWWNLKCSFCFIVSTCRFSKSAVWAGADHRMALCGCGGGVSQNTGVSSKRREQLTLLHMYK